MKKQPSDSATDKDFAKFDKGLSKIEKELSEKVKEMRDEKCFTCGMDLDENLFCKKCNTQYGYCPDCGALYDTGGCCPG